MALTVVRSCGSCVVPDCLNQNVKGRVRSGSPVTMLQADRNQTRHNRVWVKFDFEMVEVVVVNVVLLHKPPPSKEFFSE